VKTHIPGKQILDFTIETEDIAPAAVTDEQLNPTGVGGGTYTRVTVNEQGRVIHGENPTTISAYGITDAVSYTDERFNISLLTSEDEGPLRASSRQVVGTANQVVTIDGGAGGKFSIGLADNIVLPGTGAITLTSGTTAQRPTAGPGKMRFNSETAQFEGAVAGEWESFVRERDLRLSTKNTLIVQKNPGPGQFASIKAAIASITDAAVENRYVIKVAGGSYYEDNPIQMKRYVSVVGDNSTSVIVHSLNPNADLILAVIDSSIENIALGDSYGPNASAIRFDNAEMNQVTRSFFVEAVRFGRNARNVTVSSSGSYTALYMSNCQFGGSQPYDIGFYVESTNGGTARLLMRSCTTRGSLPPYATKFGYISGTGAEAVIMGSLFRTSSGAPNGTGIHLRDGGTFRTVGTTFRGFETAIWVENAGAPPMLNCYTIGLESNTTDLRIEHPECHGAFQGIAAASKVYSASDEISIMYLDPLVQGINIVGKLNLGATQSLLTDVTDLIIETAPLGLLEGGDLTPAGGRTVAVTAGAGYLRKDGNVTRVSWPATTITLAPGESTYVYVNKNGAVLTSATMTDNYTTIHLGRASASADSIVSIGALTIDIKNHGNVIETYLRDAVGPVFVSGSIVTENPTIPRAINVSAGMFYYGTSPSRPSEKTAPFMVDLHRAGGQVASTFVQQVPNDTIDNGTDLVPMTPGYYTKHALYTVSEGPFQTYYLSHGQVEYATEDEARTAPIPVPRVAPDATPAIAALVMRQGVDSIIEILDIRPMFMRAIQGTSGGTLHHGDLLGLEDDDHPQYMLATGQRALTGDLNLGGNDITNLDEINGIRFNAHGSRHTPNGADPIPTGPAITLTAASANTTGVTNFLARADHTHQITGFQPVNAELTALTAITGAGLAVHGHSADQTTHVWLTRSIQGAGGRINVTNGDAQAGNPTIDLAPAGTAGTYAQVTTDTFGRVTSGSATLDWTSITNAPSTLSGYGITDAQFKDDLLTTLADLNGNGIFVITGESTATTRSLIGPAAGVIVTNGSGVGGNPTISLGNDLAAVENLATTGFAVRAGTDTWATRSITTPNDGLVTTNGTGVGGNVIIGLEKDLAALEALTTIGFAVRTGADAWATRTLTGASGNIVITTGAGSTADPVINLATVGTPGTYGLVTTDTFGRVVSGTRPTTLVGYGITDAVSSSQVGAVNGIATLGSDGKLTSSQLPALAITDTFVVASQAAMLTIAGAEVGDVAVRTDLNRSFILRAPGANVLANWQELLTPTDAVLSVNGQTGVVNINTGVMSISAAAPTAGLTITGGTITSTGTLTFALANDLAAVEGLATNGIAVRTAADTWATRAITAGTGITITNGDGIAGNPTISLPSVGTAGTFRSVTTDAQGRVTAGTNPTTLAGYGITDAVNVSNVTSANTASTVVGRDASGNFSAGTITAALNGNASTATLAANATKLATARTINGVAFDGTADITVPTNLTDVVAAGTYDRVTVNTKGIVTGGDVTTDRMNLMYSGSIASQSGTSTIPLTATSAPTTSQGTQLVSQVITPASTASRIIIEFSGIIDTSFNGGVFLSFFRGTTCIGAVVSATQAAAGSSTVSMPETFSVRIIDTPGVTTSQTYSIRIGGNAAGTWYLGRTSGLSIGGVSRSHWSMTEII